MMEAQQAGLPIVSTDVGGVSEIVTSDTGVLMPAQFTQQQFDDAVLTLCHWKQRALREHIARQGRMLFSLENYKKFIRQVLEPQMCISEALLRAFLRT